MSAPQGIKRTCEREYRLENRDQRIETKKQGLGNRDQEIETRD